MKDLDPQLLKSMMMGDYRPGNDQTESRKDTKASKNKPISKIIDLHAEKLFINQKMPSFENILQKQLAILNEFIENAHSNRIHSIIAVHGIGEGVLKKNIYQKLAHHPKIKSIKIIDDNPYFGGASRIYLY